MKYKFKTILPGIFSLLLSFIFIPQVIFAQTIKTPNTAFINGNWFNGNTFESLTMYSVNARFTLVKPSRIDTAINLSGLFVVPPFAEAHNHNIGTGVREWDKKAIQNYLSAGVFYVMIMANPPIADSTKKLLGINQPNGVDAIFADGLLTASGGHPIELYEHVLLPRGLVPGYTKETLRDKVYFTIDSTADLERKWPLILRPHPDFIKTVLLFSEEFEKRKDDSSYFGKKGLDPRLLAKIAAKAHSNNLRIATHVATAADFHNALAAGVDVIAHIPAAGAKPIDIEDAKLAASRRIPVVTTCLDAVPSLIRMGVIQESDVRKMIIANLKVLYGNGVTLAIGSDNVDDNSVKEIFYLKQLGVFDNLTLLKMWSETTPQTIFPKRKIGALKEGYEASFLALEGNPIEDFNNITKIKYRFKQGVLMKQ